MFASLIKGCALSALTIAICLVVNGARAESYGSDAPNAGAPATQAKSKEAKVRVTPKLLVVHPQISSKKSGK
jgi:hypothetical protein